MLVRDMILMKYNPITHWVWLEYHDHDFDCVTDDFGNLIVVHEDSLLFSLINWVSVM